ncbi:MAG: hypothetical protein QXS48_00755 [Candidatus Aenigmatarchaeota archaeon]
MKKVYCHYCKQEIKPKSKYKLMTRVNKSEIYKSFPWGCYPFHLECYEENKSFLGRSFEDFSEKEFIPPILSIIIPTLIIHLIFAAYQYYKLSVLLSFNLIIAFFIVIELVPICKARKIKKLLD